MFGEDDLQHRVTQKLETLVVKGHVLALGRDARMGQGLDQHC